MIWWMKIKLHQCYYFKQTVFSFFQLMQPNPSTSREAFLKTLPVMSSDFVASIENWVI